MFRPALFLLVCAAAAFGCASNPPSKPVVQFPSAQDLHKWTTQPAPVVVAPDSLPSGEGWALQGPLPAPLSVVPWQAPTAALSQLAVTFQKSYPRSRFLESMACVARELGRFYLHEKALPQEAFRTFVLGACGAAAPSAYMGVVNLDVNAQASDEDLVSHIRDTFTAQLRKTIAANEEYLEPGVWIGREGKRFVAVFAAGQPLAQITHAERLSGDPRTVRIEGKVAVEAEFVVGHVNRGRFNVGGCITDISVPLPQFRMLCETFPGDPTSWIEVLYVRPKQVLARALFRALMRTNDEPLTYNLDSFDLQEDAAGAQAKDPRKRLIEQLNLVRRQAHLRPVLAAPEEMATAQSLAPFLFTAAASESPAADETTTNMALGLLAGWNAGGVIRTGNLIMAHVSLTQSPTRWLKTVLQTPMARVALLDQDVEKVSVGALVTEAPDSIQSVLTGWAFHHSNDHTSDVVKIYKRIIAARERLGLPMVQRLAAVGDAMKENLEDVREGKESPMDALEFTLQLAVQRYGTNMRGWVLEAHTLDAITIPEELIARRELALEIGVTHHKPPGAAWAQYVVAITYVDEGQTARSASSRQIK